MVFRMAGRFTFRSGDLWRCQGLHAHMANHCHIPDLKEKIHFQELSIREHLKSIPMGIMVGLPIAVVIGLLMLSPIGVL